MFLVGLEAGRFPRRAPVSPILDQQDRTELAAAGLMLEPREVWDARERELFRSLVAGARRGLTVSWARLDPAGRDTVRSAFVDALEDVALLEGADKDDEIPASHVVTEGVRLWTGRRGSGAGAPCRRHRMATPASGSQRLWRRDPGPRLAVVARAGVW